MYPGQQGQPGGQGPYQQPGPHPQGPYPGGPYPPRGAPHPPPYRQPAVPGPYQQPGAPGPYPPHGGPHPPQQPHPYPPQQPPIHRVGEAQMRLDPHLTGQQRALVIEVQKRVKVYVLGYFFGVLLTSGGLHYGVTEDVKGFAAAAAGLVGLAVGVVFHKRARVLREQLRQVMPDAWRSPAAHLLSARRAATLAAYLNGLLSLLAFGAAGWLLYLGAGWGAYGNSFGFAALVTGTGIPLAMGLAAASTIPQLLRVVPAGGKVGQSLYSIIGALGLTVLVKGDGTPQVVGGAVALVCAGATALLGRCVRTMRGQTG